MIIERTVRLIILSWNVLELLGFRLYFSRGYQSYKLHSTIKISKSREDIK